MIEKLKDTHFGLELEGFWKIPAFCERRQDARKAYSILLAQHADAPVIYQSDETAWESDAWVVTKDKTIRPEGWSAEIEIKSSIMPGADLKRLPKLLQAIVETGLQTNESCGMHLHIGRAGQLAMPKNERFKAWQPQEIVGFMQAFENNAEEIYGLVAPHRQRNKHTMPNALPNPEIVQNIIGAYQADPSTLEMTHVALHHLYCPASGIKSPRDYAVSLSALFTTGTIEIRLRQAEDYVNATPFISVMLHMAQAAISGKKFDWNGYAAAVANDPVLALPTATPSRPIPRPRSAPAAAARQG